MIVSIDEVTTAISDFDNYIAKLNDINIDLTLHLHNMAETLVNKVIYEVNSVPLLSTESLDDFKVALINNYLTNLQNLADAMYNEVKVTSDELERETKNLIISFNSYLTIKSMDPRPGPFKEVPEVEDEDFDLVKNVALNLNGFVDDFLLLPEDYFWVEATMPSDDTSYTQKFTDKLTELDNKQVLKYKINTIASYSNKMNAVGVNCSFYFMFKDISYPVELTKTKSDIATEIYTDKKLKDWIEFHNMDVPVY